MVAADTDAAKDAIATAEESSKIIHDSKVVGGEKGGKVDSEDRITGSESKQGRVPVSGKECGKKGSERQSNGGVYDSVANLPNELYHYYHGSNTDMGTLTEDAPTNSDGELDFPEVYRTTHQHKNKEWIDPFCAEKYAQMVTLRKESNETGRKVTPEEFSREVLRGKSTYLRGFGSGLRPSKPTAPGAMSEVRDKEVEKLKAALEEQSKEREREREEQRKEREIEREERRKEREEHQKQMAEQQKEMAQFSKLFASVLQGQESGQSTIKVISAEQLVPT